MMRGPTPISLQGHVLTFAAVAAGPRSRFIFFPNHVFTGFFFFIFTVGYGCLDSKTHSF